MTPADLGQLDVYRDEDWTWTISNLYDEAAIDMTGFGTAWEAQARITPTDDDALDITVDITDAAEGLITLSMPRAVTVLGQDSMGFDVFATSADGSRRLAVYTGTLAFTGPYTHEDES